MQKITNTLFLILTLVVNYLSVSLPLNGKTPGQLSDQYPNLFTPAPLTFAIWSVIYSVLIAFAIWQFWPLRDVARKERRETAIQTLGYDFALLSILNMGWLALWHYEQMALSVVVMFSLLTLLIRINRRFFEQPMDANDIRYFVRLPFGIYLGWISVATVANITALLVSLQWNGFGINPAIWTITVIIIAAVLAALALLRWKNVPYVGAVTWALYGIYSKQSIPLTNPRSDAVQWAAAGAMLALVLWLVWYFVKKNNLRQAVANG